MRSQRGSSKVCRVAQPHACPAGADEFRWNIHEIALRPEFFHERDEFPRTGDGTGFQDIRVHRADSWPAIGHTEEVLLQSGMIGHGCMANAPVPFYQWLDTAEIAGPDGLSLSSAAAEELVL